MILQNSYFFKIFCPDLFIFLDDFANFLFFQDFFRIRDRKSRSNSAPPDPIQCWLKKGHFQANGKLPRRKSQHFTTLNGVRGHVKIEFNSFQMSFKSSSFLLHFIFWKIIQLNDFLNCFSKFLKLSSFFISFQFVFKSFFHSIIFYTPSQAERRAPGAPCLYNIQSTFLEHRPHAKSNEDTRSVEIPENG